MLNLQREFQWVRNPDPVWIAGTRTELLSHMTTRCVFFSNLHELCNYFCKAPFFFLPLDFPQKGPSKVLRLAR